MSDDHIKRCDVRVPIDLYNEIEKIAVEEYNAPLYHKTGKPQVSGTIIELLKLGIENLRGEVSDKIPDTLSNKVRELESKIEQIQSDTLSDIKPDTNLDEKIEKAIDYAMPKAIANLKNDEEFLKAIASKVQKVPTIATDNDLYASKNAPERVEIEPDETITTQIDKTSLDPIFDGVEESEPEKLLSKKEAFAIALERGYKSGDTAFAQWFRDHKGGTLHGVKKHRARGKYVSVGE